MAKSGPDKVGSMRHRLQLQSFPAPGGTTNDFNEYMPPAATPDGFTPVATLWAQTTRLTGRELWQAQQIRPDVTVRVVIRYYKGISPRWRFVDLVSGAKLNIAFALPNMTKRWHECLCQQEINFDVA